MNTKLIEQSIPVYQDWPQPGIRYMNTIELCNDPLAFRASVDWFCDLIEKHSIKDIFAADARGFIWAAAAAYKMNIPLYTVRKKGKMPGEVWREEYQLEYGSDILELSKNIALGDRPVLIVDDVLATGGTAEAIAKLVGNLQVENHNIIISVIVNLTSLGGQALLNRQGYRVEGIVNV